MRAIILLLIIFSITAYSSTFDDNCEKSLTSCIQDRIISHCHDKFEAPVRRVFTGSEIFLYMKLTRKCFANMKDCDIEKFSEFCHKKGKKQRFSYNIDKERLQLVEGYLNDDSFMKAFEKMKKKKFVRRIVVPSNYNFNKQEAQKELDENVEKVEKELIKLADVLRNP